MTSLSHGPLPSLHPNDRIQFADDHRPRLRAGDYTVRVRQRVEVHGTQVDEPAAQRAFSIRGDQLHLEAKSILQVFPPDQSRGDFWNVLPHVVLTRDTLPWERTALAGSDHVDLEQRPPWLALLVFHGDEAPEIRNVSAKKVLGSGKKSVPGLTNERSHHEDTPVQVISVPHELVAWQLGGRNRKGHLDFRYRTHCRRRYTWLDPKGVAEAHATKEELLKAVLVANGLPLPAFYSGEITSERPDWAAAFDEVVPGRVWRLLDRTHGKQYEVCLDEAHHLEAGQTPGLSVFVVENESSTVMACRLPQPNARNAVHLVSLEGRFSPSEEEGVFILNDLPDGNVRLVSLKSWEFFCKDASESFKWLLEGLNGRVLDVRDGVVTSTDRIPSPAHSQEPSRFTAESGDLNTFTIDPSSRQIFDGEHLVGRLAPGEGWEEAARLSSGRILRADGSTLPVAGTIIDLVHHGAPEFQLPIPPEAEPMLEAWLRTGSVPLPHFLRGGERTVSWYRGPFVPAVPLLSAEGLPRRLPVHASDALLVWDDERAMFDTSYAAAWEIGRTTLLGNQRVATGLLRWKRDHAQELLSASGTNGLEHAIPLRQAPEQSAASTLDAQSVQRWFGELALLRHLPFTYLVPDERLLPPESLRFFDIDALWLKCLLDGALSIGRVRLSDSRDLAPRTERSEPTIDFEFPMSGLLVRSRVVSGWPGLDVEGFAEVTDAQGQIEATNKARLLRMERLSRNVLLCLFDRPVGGANLHLKPETLHFGFDVSDEIGRSIEPHELTKKLRDASGNEDVDHEVLLPVLDGDGSSNVTRVVDLEELQESMAQGLEQVSGAPALESKTGTHCLSGAVFALQMIAGVDRVWFKRNRNDSAEGSA